MTENEWCQFMVLMNEKVCSGKFVNRQSKEILKMTTVWIGWEWYV